MPKPLVNNKIIYQNIYGRVAQHDLYLDQGVQEGDSPTFANLQLTGNLTVQENLYVLGNTTILDSNVIEFQDNILLINRNETGAGVTLNQAGFEIERGTSENYRFVYNESNETFRIGVISNTQAVGTREDTPMINGIMTWNDSLHRMDSTNNIAIDINIISSTNSTSSTFGAFTVSGGVGIKQDLHLDGALFLTGSSHANKSILWTNSTTNSLNIVSVEDINLTPVGKILIPFNKKISIGTTEQSISANDITKDITIIGGGNVFFNLQTSKRINIPNQIPITFSTTNEKIQTDSSNNMIIASGEDIILQPSPSKRVYLPVDIPLVFSNQNQRIVANLNNDLSIFSANNVHITPGSGLDVILPTDSGIKFGSTGLQRIYSTSDNDLFILSNGIISISTGSHISIPSNTPITFGGTNQSISGNSNGHLFILCEQTNILGTVDSFSSSSGSLVINGGLGVSKNIFTTGRYTSSLSSTEAMLLKDANDNVVLNIDTTNKSTTFNSTIQINQTTGQSFGINNSLIVNESSNLLITSYVVDITNTTDSLSSSNASLMVSGGVSVNKKLRVLDTSYFQNGIDMSDTKISNVLDPLDPQDAATKAYVDLIKQGLYVKDSVKVATFTSGTLSSSFEPGSNIDNYILQLGDRILIKNQQNGVENGIYVVQTSGAPLRSLDLQLGSAASGIFVFVQLGDVNSSLGWICNNTPDNDIVGTNSLNFTQFTGLGHIIPGDGLSKFFNELSVNVDDSSIEIFSDYLRVKNTIAGTGLTGGSGNALQTITDQSHVTKLGNINTGSWEANTIGVLYGGTGHGLFTLGNILFGNNSNSIATNSLLFFDSLNTRLGLGTNTPTANLHLQNTGASVLLINADSLNLSNTSKPEIKLQYNGTQFGSIGISRNFDDFATDSYENALVISASNNSNLQLSTQQQTRITILTNGNIGINTSNPTNSLHVNGTFLTNNLVQFISTENATNSSTGALNVAGGIGIGKDLHVGGAGHIYNTTPSTSFNAAFIVHGGLTILGTENSTSISNGGALTIGGGCSLSGDLYIGGDINATTSTFSYLNLTATDEAINNTTGSLITVGGITIQCSTNSISISNGGSLLVKGGAAITKDLYVGGELNISNSISYKGNALFDTITNTSGSSNWSYFGIINTNIDGFTEIDITNGVQPSLINSLKLIASINNTTVNFAHSQSGDLPSNSISKPDFYIYEDTQNYYLFLLTPPNTTTNIHVKGQLGSSFLIQNDGYDSQPLSLIGNNLVYTTKQESNLGLNIGNLTVEGTHLHIADNIPVIGYNNINTTSSRDLGFVYQRFQLSNDLGTGDIVSGQESLIDILPSQATLTLSQLKLSNSADSTDDYYVGWWIKVVNGSNANQVRKIISYSGAFKVATLDSDWTTQNPIENDTVFLYGSSYITTYFNESNDVFKFGYASSLPNDLLQYHGDINVQMKHLFTSASTPSTSASTGSITTLGGISINNITDSLSCTNGGTFTSLGGASIRKKLYVGDNIAIGTTDFTPQESLHINQPNSTIRLENTNSYSYIDLTDVTTDNRFGILSDSLTNQFYITSTSTGNSPLTSYKAFTLTTNGYIGINTTSNINSPITINSNNFISTNSDTGYIGLIASSSNVNSSASRVVLYGTTAGNLSGNVHLHTSTLGSFIVYNNETEQLHINNNGVTHLYSTASSQSASSGALIVSGGIGIVETDNAQSSTNGGGLTVSGGVAIAKDTYIGGDLYVSGNVNIDGNIITPTLLFSNTSNCTVNSSYNIHLISTDFNANLTFAVEVTPLVSSENCQFEFELPERSDVFINRGDLIAFCSGYTDNTNLTPLFNSIITGVTGTNRGILKFQSASTSIHYFTVICSYIKS